MSILCVAAPHKIEKDQFVLVDNRYAVLDRNAIRFPLEAVVFEEGFELLQRALMHSVCRYADINCDRLNKEELKTFLARTRLAVVDHEEGERLSLAIKSLPGSRSEILLSSKKSASDGTIRQSFKLSIPEASKLSMLKWEIRNLAGRRPQIHHSTVIDENATGLSIISDVDDTIRESHVLDQKRMLRTIFFEPFQVVEPILKRIREIRRTADGSFVPLHFVSAGPAPLIESLTEGLNIEGLQDSEIYMRPFRFKDRSVYDFFREDTYAYKVKEIREIFERFPRRRFILIGDSGEKDPEVYREIHRRYPKRVEKIIIRRIKGASNEASRFQGLPIEFEDEVPSPAQCESPINL